MFSSIAALVLVEDRSLVISSLNHNVEGLLLEQYLHLYFKVIRC